MTRQRDESDALIFFASSSVSPAAPVLPTFSEPARSATLSLEHLTVPSGSVCCRLIVRSAWERDEWEFMRVEPTIRFALPHERQSRMSSSPVTNTSVRSSTKTPLSRDSRTIRAAALPPDAGWSRSRTLSL